MSDFLDHMAKLSTAEDFFTALGVPFDQQVVHVKRLHILKHFNHRLAGVAADGRDDETLRLLYAEALAAAYAEAQGVAPQQSRLFKVFRQDGLPAAPGRAFVPLAAVTR
jgi:nitrogenase-stabilizing/protective protein